jgi:glutamate carboxypeptidase
VALFTSDEEVGSPTSRALIEAQARASAYALVLESPLAGGRLKTARKGVGRFTVAITGRAAHAGIEPEKGISAVVELAHQILRLSDLADPAAGTTVNVGVVRGGSTPNVVPAEASARVDVRVTTLAEAARIEAAMAALRPVLPGATVTATGSFDRPPMERTPQSAALFERARAIAATLGQELTEGATGGASDGNFTAALGLPTLDGLGALGAGAHAADEHILIDSLPERAALLAALLLAL